MTTDDKGPGQTDAEHLRLVSNPFLRVPWALKRAAALGAGSQLHEQRPSLGFPVELQSPSRKLQSRIVFPRPAQEL